MSVVTKNKSSRKSLPKRTLPNMQTRTIFSLHLIHYVIKEHHPFPFEYRLAKKAGKEQFHEVPFRLFSCKTKRIRNYCPLTCFNNCFCCPLFALPSPNWVDKKQLLTFGVSHPLAAHKWPLRNLLWGQMLIKGMGSPQGFQTEKISCRT